MSKLFAALLLVLASQSVIAAEWYLVETTKNAFFFVDKSSMTRNGAKVKFWQWTIRNSPTGNPPYDNNKALQVANCRERTLQFENFHFFYGEDPVNSGAPSKPVIEHVAPDTAFETVYKTVCSGKFTGKPLTKLSVQDVQAAMADFYANQSTR